MVRDGLGSEEEPLGNLGVAQPLREQPEYLGLAGGQAGGMRRVAGRGPRGRSRTPSVAQTAQGQRGGGLRAERFEHRQRGTQRVGVIELGAGEGGFVWAAACVPGSRGFGPVARDLERERLRDIAAARVMFASQRQPGRQFPCSQPWPSAPTPWGAARACASA